MAQKSLKPAPPCQAATGLGNLLSSPDRKAEHTPSLQLRQAPIDIVGLLAARSGVHRATVAAHIEAFGFGGLNG